MNKLSILKMAFFRIKIYKVSFFINVFFLAILIFIEYQVYSSFSMTINLRNLLVYLMISISMFSVLSISRVPEYIVSIKKGEIVKYLVKPIRLIEFAAIEEFGIELYHIFQVFPILCIGIVFSKASFVSIFLFICSIVLSMVLSSLIATSFFSFSMILMKEASMKALLSISIAFFSGALVPFDILPNIVKEIAYFTPFSLLIDGPINILFGKNFFYIIFLQLMWIVVFCLVGNFFIEHNKKQLIIFGG